MNKIIEALYDRSDAEKWAHPELKDWYDTLGGPSSVAGAAVSTYYNFDIPDDERKEIVNNVAKAIVDAAFAIPDNPGVTRREVYMVPGCPEEPET